jgi:hypothetical protein
MLALVMQVLYPIKRALSPRAACALALLAPVALACQKAPPSSDQKDSKALAAPSAAESSTPNSAPPPTASTQAPSSELPFAGQDQRVGKFIESSAYKFRVDTVVRCADPGPQETVPEDRKLRVAAKVGVFSKYDEFFLSTQDVTLEKDGVVINSERKVKTSAECAPLLEQKRMKHDETAVGFVVFQVPDETFVRGSIVAFKPTRWGGAPRTEIKVEAKDFVATGTAATKSAK